MVGGFVAGMLYNEEYNEEGQACIIALFVECLEIFFLTAFSFFRVAGWACNCKLLEDFLLCYVA